MVLALIRDKKLRIRKLVSVTTLGFFFVWDVICACS